jgi:hypothetical protein
MSSYPEYLTPMEPTPVAELFSAWGDRQKALRKEQKAEDLEPAKQVWLNEILGEGRKMVHISNLTTKVQEMDRPKDLRVRLADAYSVRHVVPLHTTPYYDKISNNQYSSLYAFLMDREYIDWVTDPETGLALGKKEDVLRWTSIVADIEEAYLKMYFKVRLEKVSHMCGIGFEVFKTTLWLEFWPWGIQE